MSPNIISNKHKINLKKTYYFVYILQCRDESLYTGYTVDIRHRLMKHNKGQGSKYVRSRLPANLVYYETYLSKKTAIQRELEIKKLSKSQKLQLIYGNNI